MPPQQLIQERFGTAHYRRRRTRSQQPANVFVPLAIEPREDKV
jgi:hypothetical protein